MLALSAGMSWAIVLFLIAFFIFIFALMKTAKRADEEAAQWPVNIFDDAVWSEWDEDEWLAKEKREEQERRDAHIAKVMHELQFPPDMTESDR
jgi:hypothetical protein